MDKQLAFDLTPAATDCAHRMEVTMPPVITMLSTPAGAFWRAFSPDHPVADAVARFRQRFGREPEQVVRGQGLLLVGPIPSAM